MGYLNFDKTLLINLERSLSKEIIHTNRAGTYTAGTLVDCNTRKYHGLLVVPLKQPADDNYVLLSSLDETVIQYGAEFHLGLHKYSGHVFAPSGHKYIRAYDCQAIAKTTYRLGGVVITKEKLLVSFEPRVLIRYTLVEAGQPILMQFRPFMAYRSVNALTQENAQADATMQECHHGQVIRMYQQFPSLYMQFSKPAEYHHNPQWYHGIEYPKEQERGYEYSEDQLVPGYWEVPMHKGESLVFAAGVSEVDPDQLTSIWAEEAQRRLSRDNMAACLKNSAAQFYKRVGNHCYLLAGYPWFRTSAREEFMSVASCTLDIDRPEYWRAIIDETATAEVNDFISTGHLGEIEGMDEPDALLWLVRAIQKYAHKYTLHDAAEHYGELCLKIVDYYLHRRHPRVDMTQSSLLWVDGRTQPATWMNAVEDGHPITPRTGYVVEINALWYNAVCFVSEIMRHTGHEQGADLMEYRAELIREAFVHTFWNGLYLDDYVVDEYHNREVRPNQIWAASLPYSPLDKHQKKAVVDICTKELLTPRGLRTLSPKSGDYRPLYVGGVLERNRNFHNGPVWPFSLAAYARAYMSVYSRSGMSFMERLLAGMEGEMSELCIGTLNELYDGNPPYKGHGGMSYAPSVAAIISVIDTLHHYQTQQNR